MTQPQPGKLNAQRRSIRALSPVVLALVLTAATWSVVPAGEDRVLAKVGDHEILQSYVHERINLVPLAQQIDARGDLDRFVDSVIYEEVLFQFSLRQARNQPVWRDKLKSAVVRMLLEEYVRDKVGVPDDQIARIYQDEIVNGDHEHIRVRHVAFSSPAQCDWAVEQIANADDLSALAKIYHSNPAFAERGGDLGYLMRRSRVLGFEPEVFDLAEGRLHRIDKSGICHLIWITERNIQAPPPFDEIKGRLRRQLERRQEAALLEAVLDQAKKTVAVERRPPPQPEVDPKSER